MKHIEKVEVPATMREFIDFVTCDLCKEKITPGSQFDATEIEVRCVNGDNFPDGGSTTEKSFDICRKCFEKKLIPWFRSQGAEPCIEEHNW